MSKKAVLIVDDNLEVRMAFGAVLNLDGYEVVLAGDGRDAVEAARAHRPAVIMMDIDMPVMTGFEAAAALKADPTTREIPIIAITGRDLAEEGVAAGLFADFAQKPIGSRALMAMIEGVIGPP